MFTADGSDCPPNLCSRYLLSAAMAFLSWFLSLGSSLFNLWLLPSLWDSLLLSVVYCLFCAVLDSVHTYWSKFLQKESFLQNKVANGYSFGVDMKLHLFCIQLFMESFWYFSHTCYPSHILQRYDNSDVSYSLLWSGSNPKNPVFIVFVFPIPSYSAFVLLLGFCKFSTSKAL